jgi:hypothetical protein
MRVLKKGNNNTKSLAYTSLVRPIIEYEAVCWDPCREGQINALERVQKKAAKFAIGHNHRNVSDWESFAQRRKIADDHDRKIRNRKQITDIGKYSYVNKTIQLRNSPPSEALVTFPCKPHIFRKTVRILNISEV